MQSKSGMFGLTGVGAMLAIIALLFRSPERQEPAPISENPSTSKTSDSTQNRTGSQDFEGGKRRLDAFLDRADTDQSLHGYTLDFMLVTVPDPIDSHLDWMFDAQIAALLGAYARAGFVCDSFWLPWRSEDGAAGETLPSSDARRVRRSSPGVFLFRHHDPSVHELELCYVVGELPTSGVNKAAFLAALIEREKLRNSLLLADSPRAKSRTPDKYKDDVLRIVGPTFSGSSLSLRGLLDRWLERNERRRVEIVTGSATSLDNEWTLTSAWSQSRSTSHTPPEEKGRPTTLPRIGFRSTVHPDETLLAVLEEDVLSHLELSTEQVALIVESSTQYGESAAAKSTGSKESDQGASADSQPRRTKEHYLRIPFPANVGSLRTAYARDWQAQANANAAISPSKSPRVDLNLDEPLRPRETPRLQSTLTPAMIDLMMAEMARTLKNHGIRVVVLFATDVRDKLFLGEEIKQRLPDVQLVTTESNLLYLRPDFNDALRGMLVISSYPLFVRPSDWQPQLDGETEIAFSCEGGVGTYNALLMLLDPESQLADYRPPVETPLNDSSRLPPVWVTAVGKSSMLPVMLGSCREETERYPAPSSKPPKQAADIAESPPRFLALAAALLFGLAIAGLLIERLVLWIRGAELSARLSKSVLRPNAGRNPEERWRIERISLALARETYTALLFLALAGMFAPTAALVVIDSARSRFGLPLQVFCVLIGLMGLGAVLWKTISAGKIAMKCFRESVEGRRLLGKKLAALELTKIFAEDGYRYTLDVFDEGTRAGVLWMTEIAAFVCVAVLGAIYGSLTVGLAIEECLLLRNRTLFELFFHRASSIDQGLSLLAPLFFIGTGLIAWCSWNLDRIRLLARREAFESWHARDPDGACHGTTQELRDRLFWAFPDGRSLLLFGSLILIGAWSLCLFERSMENLTGLDDRILWFDWMLRIGILGMLFAMIWVAYRFVGVWFAMRANLSNCDEQASMQAYARLRDSLASPTSLDLWLRSTHKRLDHLGQRIWKRMQSISTERQTLADASRENVVWLMHRTFTPVQVAEPLVDEAERSDILAKTYSVLSKMPLEPESASKAVADGGDSAKKPADTGANPAASTWPRLAEDFLALQFMEYIQWVLSHLRGMALFLLSSLILMTLLLSCYPFYPRSLFKLMFLFVVIATIGALLMVIIQMNRDPVLSRITGTEAGQLTWNRAFIAQVVVFGLIPLLTLLSAEFPEVHQIFFAWVDPLIKAIVKA